MDLDAFVAVHAAEGDRLDRLSVVSFPAAVFVVLFVVLVVSGLIEAFVTPSPPWAKIAIGVLGLWPR